MKTILFLATGLGSGLLILAASAARGEPPTNTAAPPSLNGERPSSRPMDDSAPPGAAARPPLRSLSVGVGGFYSESPYQGIGHEGRVLPTITYFGSHVFIAGPTAGVFIGPPGTLRASVLGRVRFRSYKDSDSPALAGMDDRRETFEAGMNMDRRLGTGRLSVEIMTDTLGRHNGQYATARVSRGVRFSQGSLTPALSLGWQNARMSDYYYGVDEHEAAPGRPPYTPGDTVTGEAGLMLLLHPFDPWTITLGTGIEWMDGAIRDSPIVEQGRLFHAFGGLARHF